MMNQKQINDALREDLQDGYVREYDLQQKLSDANEEVMSLKAELALLKQKLVMRRRH